MNFFAFSGLLNGTVLTVCGLVVLLNNSKSRRNRSYVLYCLSGAVWSYCYCFWQMSDDAVTALFWSRGLMMGAIFIPLFHYLHFVTMFDLETPRRKRLVKVSTVLTVAFFVSNFTPLFIKGVEKRMFFPYWPIPGPLFHPYLLMFYILVLLSLRLAWEYRQKASPLIRNQLVWIIGAAVIGYGGASANFALWYNIPIPPYTNSLVLIYVALPPLIFFKLRLFDIHLFFRDTIVYLMSLIGLIVFLIGGAIYFAPSSPRMVGAIISVIGVLTAPALYPLFKRKLKPFIERSLFPGRFEYLGQVAESLEPIRESYTFGDLARNVVGGIDKVFEAETCIFFIRDRLENSFKIQGSVGLPPGSEFYMKLNPSDALVRFSTQYKKVFVKEEQERRLGTAFHEIAGQLEDFNCQVCCPMFSKRTLEGIIMIGPKINRRMYHDEDHEILTVFTREAEEMLRHLSSMVSLSADLRRLVHDVRNITQKRIGTSLYVLSESNLQKEQQEEVSLLKESVTDLESYMSYLMDWGRLMDERIRGYAKQSVDIGALISKAVLELKEAAGRQKINLLETSSIPGTLLVAANAMDIKRVVTNLVANALRYTPEGGSITVHSAVVNGHVQLIVKDTGKGINKEDLQHIFEPGYQGSETNRGTAGLGLAIVNEVIEMHGGRIWAESEGPRKGSSFILMIPIHGTSNQEV